MAGGRDNAGAAGVIVVPNGPTPCTTPEGEPGIIVDVFPFPGPDPRCEALAQPGTLDATCPSDELFRCGFDDCNSVEEMAGCCRPDGQCGLLETGYFGAGYALGCLDREPWVDGMKYLNRPVTPMSCSPR